MAIKFTQDGNLSDIVVNKAKEKINKKLNEVYAEVIPLTPVSKSVRATSGRQGHTGGRLKRGWAIIPAEDVNGVVTGYLYNNVHYAAHVNYGHRTRLGMGLKYTNLYNTDGTKKKRYVEGRHFLEKALTKCGIESNKRWEK